jgi:hypothetical protein
VIDVYEEAFEEAIGRSSKRWALRLVAFVAGAAAAVWLASRVSARKKPGSAVERSADAAREVDPE